MDFEMHLLHKSDMAFTDMRHFIQFAFRETMMLPGHNLTSLKQEKKDLSFRGEKIGKVITITTYLHK